MESISDDLIHFVGDWSGADRTRIQRAIQTFEARWRASADRSSTIDDTPWIAVQESPSWGEYYCAHRLGTHDSLTGRSVTELASVIEESAQEL